MQSPNVTKAKILDFFNIAVAFENGEVRIFDLKPYLDYPLFKPLKNKSELESFSIVDGTIEWKCGADLSTDTFYIESKPIDKNAVI